MPLPNGKYLNGEARQRMASFYRLFRHNIRPQIIQGIADQVVRERRAPLTDNIFQFQFVDVSRRQITKRQRHLSTIAGDINSCYRDRLKIDLDWFVDRFSGIFLIIFIVVTGETIVWRIWSNIRINWKAWSPSLKRAQQLIFQPRLQPVAASPR